MGISAKQYQAKVKQLMKISLLREIVKELLLKDEKTLKLLKEQDFLRGDIYGNDRQYNYRSQSYSLFKQQMNPLARGKVDLILTGAFVDAMFLKSVGGGKYMFGNSDSKAGMLVETYGREILGLNNEVFTTYQKEILKARFVRELKKYL